MGTTAPTVPCVFAPLEEAKVPLMGFRSFYRNELHNLSC